MFLSVRRVSRGLAPLEIKKQKKKVIRANFKLFHLYFATFLVETSFSQLFSFKKLFCLKAEKNNPYTPGHAPGV